MRILWAQNRNFQAIPIPRINSRLRYQPPEDWGGKALHVFRLAALGIYGALARAHLGDHRDDEGVGGEALGGEPVAEGGRTRILGGRAGVRKADTGSRPLSLTSKAVVRPDPS